ncbi:MAG: hypothetical protein AAF682_04635 [Planctomycetota bacterium]
MADDERFLEDALASSPGEEPAEALEHLASSADSRERLAELRAAEAAFVEAGEDARSVLAEAEELHEAPGLDAAAELLAKQVRSVRGAQPARLMPLVAVASLVAASVMAWLLFGPSDSGGEPQDPGRVYLGPGDDPVLSHPIGAVPAYDEFRWDVELVDGQRLELMLFDLTSDPPRPLGALQEPQSSPWIPPPSLALESVERLRWTLTVVDSTGVVASSAGEAWLE